VRRGRDASLEAGENLLRESVRDPALKGVGFIVITAFGHESPDLAVELMKIGATDFVRKPYHGLEKKVREFLDRRAATATPLADAPAELRPFTGGELIFHQDRVELNGIVICGDAASGIIRHVLEQLSQRDAAGEFVRLPAKIIVDPFGGDKTQTVIDAINRFRERVGELMKPHGILIGRDDVIATRQGGAGYQLARNIVVRGKISGRPPVPAAEREPTAEERQKWIVAQV
jgi:hypothetical protein